MRDPYDIVLDLLKTAHRVALGFGDSDTEEVRDEHSTDISTKADRALSKAIIDRALALSPGCTLLTEEAGKIEGEGEITIAVDDLDGTDNFFRARELLPWCSVVTIFKGRNPRFRDAVAAGIIEHRSGTIWAVSSSGASIERRADGVEKSLRTSRKAGLDRRTLVAFDHYSARGGVSRFSRLHEQCWVKDFGSSALHLALVAAGRIEAFVNPVHKGHELGAGYLLVTSAGGTVETLDGGELGDLPFDFNATYPVLVAASEDLSKAIRETIQKAHDLPQNAKSRERRI
ncbi:MAG: inositol monophosphatase family protein [Spirochaetota bacterium]